MTITHRWYDEQRIVIITLQGELTGQEILEAYSALCLDDRYYSSYHQLWDCRSISSLKMGRRDIKALKMMVDMYSPPEQSALKRRVAILAPQYYIYATAYALLSIMGKQSRQRKVFRTFAAAKSWLSAVLDRGSRME